MEAIGKLWELGEETSAKGDILQGLLHYHRAKALLVNESKLLFNDNSTFSSNSRISRLYGEIMEKLTASITRDTTLATNNPITALGLTKDSINKNDIKSQYRKCILKYHPDKNQDCDTSSIFTTIQAAYEKLKCMSDENVLAIPKSNNNSNNNNNNFNARESYATKCFNPKQSGAKPANDNTNIPKQTATYDHSTATNNRPKSGHKDKSTTSYTSPYDKQHLDKKVSQSQTKKVVYEASDIVNMSTDLLKKLLKQWVGDRVYSMGREELIRKYLSINSHLDAQGVNKKSKPPSGDSHPRKQNDIPTPDLSKEDHTSTSTTSNLEHEEMLKRKAEADKQRIKRVEKLQVDIPLMNIIELKRFMETSGISSDGCIEKEDLIQQIFAFYGIKQNKTNDAKTKSNISPAEAALKSSFSINMSSKMDINSLKRVVGFSMGTSNNINEAPSLSKSSNDSTSDGPIDDNVTSNTSTQSCNNSPEFNHNNNNSKPVYKSVVTKEKLIEIETKMLGKTHHARRPIRSKVLDDTVTSRTDSDPLIYKFTPTGIQNIPKSHKLRDSFDESERELDRIIFARSNLYSNMNNDYSDVSVYKVGTTLLDESDDDIESTIHITPKIKKVDSVIQSFDTLDSMLNVNKFHFYDNNTSSLPVNNVKHIRVKSQFDKVNQAVSPEYSAELKDEVDFWVENRKAFIFNNQPQPPIPTGVKSDSNGWYWGDK